MKFFKICFAILCLLIIFQVNSFKLTRKNNENIHISSISSYLCNLFTCTKTYKLFDKPEDQKLARNFYEMKNSNLQTYFSNEKNLKIEKELVTGESQILIYKFNFKKLKGLIKDKHKHNIFTPFNGNIILKISIDPNSKSINFINADYRSFSLSFYENIEIDKTDNNENLAKKVFEEKSFKLKKKFFFNFFKNSKIFESITQEIKSVVKNMKLDDTLLHSLNKMYDKILEETKQYN